MKKHAYLIVAHNEFDALKLLLHELDDERNDIFIHIDKKAKNYKQSEIEGAVKKAGIFFVKRKSISWGDISLTLCEIDLLKAATKKDHYHYYHMISGADFPIKSQDYIHDFLKDEKREFVDGFRNGEFDNYFYWKIQFYHPLMKFVGRGIYEGKTLKEIILRKLGKFQYDLYIWQKNKGVDRLKGLDKDKIMKGSNWFSITDDFARFVVSYESKIKRRFFWTNTSDEFFVLYALVNSPYEERIAFDNLRLIDWNRGTPYEFSIEDLEELKASPKFFARKMSYIRHPDLYDALILHLGTMK